jgi:hypothetical protein
MAVIIRHMVTIHLSVILARIGRVAPHSGSHDAWRAAYRLPLIPQQQTFR